MGHRVGTHARARQDSWRVSGLALGRAVGTRNRTQGVARGSRLAPETQGYGEGQDLRREAAGRDKMACIGTIPAPHRAASGHSHASRLAPGPPSSSMQGVGGVPKKKSISEVR
jgi:hypothetical protein